jgi:hypothetical protein
MNGGMGWILCCLLGSRSTLAQVRILQVLHNGFGDLGNERWVQCIWWLRLTESPVNGIADRLRLRLRLIEEVLIDGARARS